MKRKYFGIFVTLVMIISSIVIPTNVKFANAAGGGQEQPLNYSWINEIVENLSLIVKQNKTYNLWQGRDFGTNGEREAAYRIKEWMTLNSKNLNASVYLDRVGNESYTGPDYKIQHRVNDIIEISDYSLQLKNTTIISLTIPDNETFPIPKLVWSEAWTEVTSGGFYDVEPVSGSTLTNLISDQLEISYTLLDNANAACEYSAFEVVNIEDYSTASENETTGKIHLLEFLTNESEDAYQTKVDKVVDSGGSGFLFTSTNPSYIKDLPIDSFGLAISSEDGVKIKNYLNSDATVILSFPETEDDILPTFGTFSLYIFNQRFEEKKIGLMEETSDYPPSQLFIWCNLPYPISPYIGFILCNKTTFETTHYMLTATKKPFKSQNIPATMLSRYRRHPVFFVNGTIRINQSTSIDLWDWEKNDTSLQAKFNITERKNENIESYNVICEVPGKNQSKSIMISGGHHDYFPGQGAADNTVGVATMLGVLRWLNESDITPEYNVTFASWAGEERIIRGSSSYVFNQSNYRKNENITYMINLDFFALDSPGSELNIITSTKAFLNEISNTTNRTNYLNRTNYKLKIYKEDGEYYKIVDDAEPLYLCYVNDSPINQFFGPFKKKTDLQIVTVGKTNMRDIVRHRSGGNHDFGDVLNHINQTDLNCTAEMVFNITKYLILEPPENEFVNCDFITYDRCGDSWNDSVNISLNVTTNRTSWATVEASIRNASTGINVSDVNSTWFTVYTGENISGQITVTLYPIMKNDTYNVSIRIIDDRGNVDDECHQLVNLSPYGKPMARFNYSYGELIGRYVYFNDASMASPGADINQWYWDFDDGTHSHDQNPSHLYLISRDYDVTLTVWDTNGFNDSWSDTLTVPNSSPSSSFTINANAVCVGTQLSFTSTSSDEDGTIENYTWCFGDESYSYAENPVHSYSQSGVYTVTLTTTDDDGAVNTATETDCLVIADAMVDDDFSDNPGAHKWDTIQEGIDDVGDSGIVYVFNGSYDPIEIEKPVALYGENRETVVISGGDPGVKILSYNVSLKGFTISDGTCGVDIVKGENITIEDCEVSGNSNLGISLDWSYNCSITNCSISESDTGVKIFDGSEYNVIKQSKISESSYGVYISGSSHNWIGSPYVYNPYPTDCTFTLNDYAVYLYDADSNFILGCDIDGTPPIENQYEETIGICLEDSEENTISTCKIHDATIQGISLDGSARNKVEHCKITENKYGIDFSGSASYDNLIVQNSITDNTLFGIHLPSPPENNLIYYNDFIQNGNDSKNQSYDANGRGEGEENLWNKEGNHTLTKEGPGEGNYWSDYKGVDDNQDGIGDTPYELEGGPDREDSYPVIESYNWCNDWE